MTAQDLHIEIDLLLQKVNTHWNQNLLPQEKDLFLNREVTRFIKQRLNTLSNIKREALFDTVKRTVDLVPLIKTVSVPVMYGDSDPFISFPFDYLYHISTELKTSCSNDIEKTTSTFYELVFSPIKEITDLPVSVTIGTLSFDITASDIPDDYLIESTIPIYKNSILLIEAFLTIFKKKVDNKIEITYDKQTNKFTTRSNQLFFIGGISASPIGYDEYLLESNLASSVTVIDDEFITKFKNSSLSSSKDNRCNASLRKTALLLYPQNGIIYGKAKITYLCKPTKINLLLDSNSELTDEVLEEIVANTVQRLQGVINTDNYEKFVRENILIE